MNLLAVEKQVEQLLIQFVNSPQGQADIQFAKAQIMNLLLSKSESWLSAQWAKITNLFKSKEEKTMDANTQQAVTTAATTVVTAVTTGVEDKKTELINSLKTEIANTSSSWVKTRDTMYIALIEGADQYLVELLADRLAKL
jgi:hypothetical protein